MSPEMRPKSSGTFEKRVPEQVDTESSTNLDFTLETIQFSRNGSVQYRIYVESRQTSDNTNTLRFKIKAIAKNSMVLLCKLITQKHKFCPLAGVMGSCHWSVR